MANLHLKTLLIGLLLIPLNVVFAATQQSRFTLEQAINFALDNNPELSIMQNRIEQANVQLGEALANFYPQIKTSLSYQHTDNPAQAFAMIIAQRRLDLNGGNFNHPGGIDNFRPQISASYSLFRGGQDYYLSEAAKLGIASSELEKSATRNRLINHVTAAYYGQLAAMDAHKVSVRSIDAVQSELKQSRINFQAGTLLKSDVLSLEVQLAEAKDAEIQAGNAIELANTMLKTLLGLSARENLTLNIEHQPGLPKAPGKFEKLVDEAFSHHPELKAAEMHVLITERQLAAAKAAHLPKADAFVNYGSDSQNFTYSAGRDNVSAGVMLEMELFGGFATTEKIKKAELDLKTAKTAVLQAQLQIENQVKTAQLRLQEALSRAEVTNVAVVAAEEALDLVNTQWQGGVVTVTRYIEAEVARDKAHTRAITARFDALRAEAELKQATGYWL